MPVEFPPAAWHARRPLSDPVISVIVLNWNAAKWIPRCLESLRAQTIFPWTEIIFADNASTDGSEQVARECMAGWSNGVVVQNGGNFGFADALDRVGVLRVVDLHLYKARLRCWILRHNFSPLCKGL